MEQASAQKTAHGAKGIFPYLLRQPASHLPTCPASAHSSTISTVTKAKKSTPKIVRLTNRATSAARPVRLVPPPGIPVSEFLKRLPPPSKEFDADFVADIVARRSDR
jgi:hypothetical protein